MLSYPTEISKDGDFFLVSLRYFYGDDMYINIAPEISGIPSSWPGYVLEIGSSGELSLIHI